MDKIIIKGLRLYAYHGVNAEEKQNGQTFVIDVTAEADLSLPSVSDKLDDTVSYSALIKLIRRVFTAEKYDLIEKCAGVLCDAVLDFDSRIQAVEVCVAKPDAPMKADFETVEVEIRRERQ